MTFVQVTKVPSSSFLFNDNPPSITSAPYVAPLLIILAVIPQITFGGGLLPANSMALPGRIVIPNPV